MRCGELLEYLQKIEAPNEVWLSEDGSGIIKRAVYDMHSNKLVGINLPISELTGMPITNSYFARTLAEITKHLKNPLSTLIYMIMAQPVKSNCPPFVLMLFGTDNKFTAQNVLDRWNYTIHELEKWVDSRSICLMAKYVNVILNFFFS